METLISLFVYFTTIFISISLLIVYVRNKIEIKSFLYRLIWKLLIIAPILLVSTFRADTVGVDTLASYYPYWYSKYMIFGTPYTGFEFLFYLLLKISYILFHSFNGFKFITALFCLSFGLEAILYFRKKNIDVVMGYSIFLFLIYFEEFNITRQICAVCLVFWGMRYLEQDKPLKYLLVSIISVFIHTSSIVSIVYFFFYYIKNKKWLFKITVVLIFILPLLYTYLYDKFHSVSLFSKYYSFAHYTYNLRISVSGISLLIYFLPLILIILIYRKKILNGDNIFKVTFLVSLLFYSCCSFKVYMVWAYRMMYYGAFSLCILIPYIKTFIKKNQDRRAYKLCIYTYCYFYFIFYYAILGNGGIFPYLIGG